MEKKEGREIEVKGTIQASFEIAALVLRVRKGRKVMMGLLVQKGGCGCGCDGDGDGDGHSGFDQN